MKLKSIFYVIFLILSLNLNILKAEDNWTVSGYENTLENKTQQAIKWLFFPYKDNKVFYTVSTEKKGYEWDYESGIITDTFDVTDNILRTENFHYIDSNYLLSSYTTKLNTVTIYLYDYKNKVRLYEMFIDINDYVGSGGGEYSFFLKSLLFDPVNLKLFLDLEKRTRTVKYDYTTVNYYELRDLKTNIVLNKLESPITFIKYDTIKGNYFVKQGYIYKTDSLLNKINSFVDKDGYFAYTYPTLSNDFKLFSCLSNKAQNPQKYLIWDTETFEVIDSLNLDLLDDFFINNSRSFFKEFYTIFSNDNSNLIISGINAKKSRYVSKLKFYNIKKQLMHKSIDFDDMYISNPIQVPNENTILLTSSHNKIFKINYDQLLSVEDNQSETTFNIYPNPTSDFINIVSEDINSKVEIFNQLGEVKLTTSGNTPIFVGDLIRGVYYLRFGNKTQMFVRN